MASEAVFGRKRVFRVYTFANRIWDGRPLTKSRIHAYTRWANPAWEGCRVYDVEAESGAAAKKLAVEMRLADERKEQA